MNKELADVQAGFTKGRGTRNEIAKIHWIIEKAREFQKKIYFLIDSIKDFTVWITTNYGKCFTQMPANLENSAVATGLKKVSFHSNPKEGQCQKLFKLLYNCTHFTC